MNYLFSLTTGQASTIGIQGRYSALRRPVIISLTVAAEIYGRTAAPAG